MLFSIQINILVKVYGKTFSVLIFLSGVIFYILNFYKVVLTRLDFTQILKLKCKLKTTTEKTEIEEKYREKRKELLKLILSR